MSPLPIMSIVCLCLLSPAIQKLHADRQRICQEQEFGPGGDGGWWEPLILRPEVPATRLHHEQIRRHTAASAPHMSNT